MIKRKEYRLKKAIITPVEAIPVGTVLEFINGIGRTMGYHCRIEEDLIKNFDEWFEKTEESPERWRAEKRGEYFTVLHGGTICTEMDIYGSNDDYSWWSGNYFKTVNEAKRYREYLCAKQRLKDSAGGYVPRRTDMPYGVLVKGNKLYIEVIPYTAGGIFFSSREVAEESLEKYRDDWEFVTRYEAGEL